MAADTIRPSSFLGSLVRCSPRRTLAVITLLAPFAGQAAADVVPTGDVSPSFVAAPTVDLTSQRIFIGNTSGAVGTLGTLDVAAGGSLTAAQIVPGVGGLGVGIVNVTGAGSIIQLTGGGAFNGLDIGSWGTGTVTVSNSGAIVCASPLACPFSGIGNAAGSAGTLAINGASVTGLGSLTVGQGTVLSGFGTPGANTTGNLSITGGGILGTTGFSAVATNGGTGVVTGNVTIDGVGSTWGITRDLANGGGQAGLTLGAAANTNAGMTIGNGGNLSVTGARSNPAGDNSIPFITLGATTGATGAMTVTSGGTVVFAGESGGIGVGGTSTGIGGTGILNITGGGSVSGVGNSGLIFMAIGRNQGTGTVNVSGTGTQLVLSGVGGVNTQGLNGIGGLMIVGRNQGNGGGTGTLNVTGGGSVLLSDKGLVASTGIVELRIAQGTGSTGTVAVSGASSSLVVSSTSGVAATTPAVQIGAGGVGQMTISNGASVSLLGTGQRNFVVGNSSTGSGSLSMTNNSSMNASWFGIGNIGGTGVATIDQSTVNLDGVVFFNGNPFGAGVRVGRGLGSNGTLNLQNGAVVNIDNSISDSSVILGGTSALAGGNGNLNMSGGSAINFTGAAASASVQVGGVAGTGFMTMTGNSTVNVGATGSVQIAATAGSDGNLTMSGGSLITANVIGIGGSSDTAAGGLGSATITGLGTRLQATGDQAFVSVGRSGTGDLVVSNQATLEATVLNVGRAVGGNGTMTVDNATLALSGQRPDGVPAGIAIGNRGGTGALTVLNGSQITITNMGVGGAALNVGGTPQNPLGTGSLDVSGSQITLTAQPGLAAVRIGHDGTGAALFTGSTLNVANGSVIIAGQPGSTGTLTVNAGSVVTADYVGVGATLAGQGGNGHLIVNNSTINTGTFEIGRNGTLSGNGGIIDAIGDVIVGGTISPGNSPGRLVIHCNIISLDGSRLILDILGVGPGFEVDQLVIGNGSTFDLKHLNIVFNFLGDTDPNLFAASGGFDLDNFLRSGLGETTDVGLSEAFAAGETWGDIVDPSRITATSSVFAVTDLQLGVDGSISVTAAPIPEPSTWAALLLGLAGLGAWTRRRAAAKPARQALNRRFPAPTLTFCAAP